MPRSLPRAPRARNQLRPRLRRPRDARDMAHQVLEVPDGPLDHAIASRWNEIGVRQWRARVDDSERPDTWFLDVVQHSSSRGDGATRAGASRRAARLARVPQRAREVPRHPSSEVGVLVGVAVVVALLRQPQQADELIAHRQRRAHRAESAVIAARFSTAAGIMPRSLAISSNTSAAFERSSSLTRGFRRRDDARHRAARARGGSCRRSRRAGRPRALRVEHGAHERLDLATHVLEPSGRSDRAG